MVEYKLNLSLPDKTQTDQYSNEQIIMFSTSKELQEEEYSFVPSHFGDIMSQNDTTTILQGKFSPIERVFLTANGNLQRLLNAYYNEKIYIEFVKNIDISTKNESDKIYDREVNLCCQNQVVCNAVSLITVTDPHIIQLIESGEVGIGQVFRYLSILPEFELILIKKKLKIDQLIRQYKLSIPGFSCSITETFHPDFLNLKFQTK